MAKRSVILRTFPSKKKSSGHSPRQSNEAFNRASGLLTVLPVTSVKPGRSPHPFEVFLPAGAAGNPVDSIILPHQIRTISAGRLRQRYGQLNDTALRREVAERVLGHLGFSDLREVEEEL